MAEQAQQTDGGPRPIVPILKLAPEPHLVGIKCTCGAIYLEERRVACSRCSSTGPFEQVPLSNRGKVYVFSVVHQSFPGIPVPYITAIVDLPEGVSVRANLIDVAADQAQNNPKSVFDLPVEMITQVVAKDREGHEVVAFCYRPARH